MIDDFIPRPPGDWLYQLDIPNASPSAGVPYMIHDETVSEDT